MDPDCNRDEERQIDEMILKLSKIIASVSKTEDLNKIDFRKRISIACKNKNINEDRFYDQWLQSL